VASLILNFGGHAIMPTMNWLDGVNWTLTFHYIKTLSRLETLHLEGVQITSSGLKLLSDNRNKQLLVLKNTKISDEGLMYLRNMNKLQELNLMNTNITDKGLDYLAALPNLQTIMVRGTKITKNGFNKFKKRFPTKYITFETEEEMK
jgi:hypothetical protein